MMRGTQGLENKKIIKNYTKLAYSDKLCNLFGQICMCCWPGLNQARLTEVMGTDQIFIAAISCSLQVEKKRNTLSERQEEIRASDFMLMQILSSPQDSHLQSAQKPHI